MEIYKGEGEYTNYGTHTVKVKMQWGRYKGEVVANEVGNIEGLDALRTVAVSVLDGGIEYERTEVNKNHIEFVDGVRKYAKVKNYKLYDGDETKLIDGTDIKMIKKAITGLEIIGYKKSVLNDDEEE